MDGELIDLLLEKVNSSGNMLLKEKLLGILNIKLSENSVPYSMNTGITSVTSETSESIAIRLTKLFKLMYDVNYRKYSVILMKDDREYSVITSKEVLVTVLVEVAERSDLTSICTLGYLVATRYVDFGTVDWFAVYSYYHRVYSLSANLVFNHLNKFNKSRFTSIECDAFKTILNRCVGFAYFQGFFGIGSGTMFPVIDSYFEAISEAIEFKVMYDLDNLPANIGIFADITFRRSGGGTLRFVRNVGKRLNTMSLERSFMIEWLSLGIVPEGVGDLLTVDFKVSEGGN